MKLNLHSLSARIPLMIVGVAVTAVAIISTISFLQFHGAVNSGVESRLKLVADAKTDQLQDWLSSIEADLTALAANAGTTDAIVNFEGAWQSLKAKGDPTSELQKLYINDNPHPTGQKEKLDRAGDDSYYSDMHARFHPAFRTHLQEKGYYDIFLFNPEGDLLYTVFKELDYASNLLTGKWASSGLGEAFRMAKNNPKADYIFFNDFAPYAPSHGAPASFMSKPVLRSDGSLLGVLVFQMPIDRLNALMKSEIGLGETGETYIVGQDNLMRSDSRHSEESTLLVQKVDTEQVSRALNGERGFGTFADYKGEKVAAAFEPLSFKGVTWAIIVEQHYSEAFVEEGVLTRNIIIVTLLILVAVTGAGLFVGRGLSKPITSIIGVMGRISKNELDVEIPSTERKDEIGDIARALEIFRAAGKERIELERRNEENVRRAREEAEHQLTAEIGQVVERVAGGDLSARVELDGRDGVILHIGTELNTVLEVIASVNGELRASMDAMSRGDLTQRISADYQGEFEQIKISVNNACEELEKMVSQTTQSVNAVSNSVREISAGTDDLSTRTERQASNLEQTAAAIEELSTTVRQNADNAVSANSLSSDAKGAAQSGSEIVKTTVQAMSSIEEMSSRIVNIVGVIDELSHQTNLLALNAAVEAARAGEAGKGFEVVASEVRSLAQRSSQSSKEIRELILNSDEQVKRGVALVGDAGTSLEEIVDQVDKVASIVSEIASACQEQATGLDEINSAVTSLDEITQQNAALVEETTASVGALSNEADKQSQIISFFRISQSAAGDTFPSGLSVESVSQHANVRVTPDQRAPAAPSAPAKLEPVPTQGNLAVALDEDPDWEEF